jgi:DNA replication protein DnaC
MNSLNKYKKSPQWTKDGGQFIPHAATWLNQERWNDELEAKVGSNEKYQGI